MMAKCLRHSFNILPPTHFLTFRSKATGETDKAYTAAITKSLLALKRRCPGKQLEYLWVNEWRHGVRHAHALIRISGTMSQRAIRDAAQNASGMAELRCSLTPVWSVPGVANYIFKHTRRLGKKADLTPANFRGRMYTASKGFLTKPFKELWQEVRPGRTDEVDHRPSNDSTGGARVTLAVSTVVHSEADRDEGAEGRHCPGRTVDVSEPVTGLAGQGCPATRVSGAPGVRT